MPRELPAGLDGFSTWSDGFEEGVMLICGLTRTGSKVIFGNGLPYFLLPGSSFRPWSILFCASMPLRPMNISPMLSAKDGISGEGP